MIHMHYCSGNALQELIDSPDISEEIKVSLREEQKYRQSITTPETLGDIAAIFLNWKDAGITRESIEYVTNKVYWE